MRPHELNCAYLQTKLAVLCTCPRVASLPTIEVQHHPLCDEMDKDYEGYCLCDPITKTREQAIRDCITVIEELTYGTGMGWLSGEWINRDGTITALRALLEDKPQ